MHRSLSVVRGCIREIGTVPYWSFSSGRQKVANSGAKGHARQVRLYCSLLYLVGQHNTPRIPVIVLHSQSSLCIPFIMISLKVHLAITSRYQVLDRSGRLPFSVVFGLCRQKSEQDTDPRPLILNTANSILDLPYALSHKLLTLHSRDAEGNNTEIDVGHLNPPQRKEQSYITLPSPVGRTKNWKRCMSIYLYDIDPASELGSLLEPGKKYIIRNQAGQELGFTDYGYSEQDKSANRQGLAFTPNSENRWCPVE